METEKLTDKIIITIATKDDLPDLYRMIDEYNGNHLSPYATDIDKIKIRQAFFGLIEICGVLLGKMNGNTIGVMAGYVTGCLFSKEILFSTMFFYVAPEYRKHSKAFLKELELSLLPTNINRIIISVPNSQGSETMKRFMTMMGYSELEVHYAKRI